MALPPRDLRHQYLRFEELQYIDVDIAYFETRFREAVLELDTAEALQFQLEGARCRIRLIAYSIAGRCQAPEKVLKVVRFREEAEGHDIWRQYVVAAGAPEAAENALVADEGALAVPAPVQAPQSPHYNRTNYDYGTEAGVRYTSYADFQIPYVRRTRCGTTNASTSTAQQDEQQLDP
ncbi:hypothetical protein Tco_1468976 [Tanacetum coccineum]